MQDVKKLERLTSTLMATMHNRRKPVPILSPPAFDAAAAATPLDLASSSKKTGTSG